MRTSDLVQEVYAAILVNKARSGLTILGIVIGIGSVIAMIALGAGAQATIESNIQSIGSNLLTIRPGAQRGFGEGGVRGAAGSANTLTMDDVNAIQSGIEGLAGVAPEVSGRYQVVARGTNTNTSVLGTSPEYEAVRNVTTELGSFISDIDIRNVSKVAVLGPSVHDDLFGEGSDATGQKIRINGINFTVIGVTASKGGSSFGNSDDMIFIPVSTAQRFLSGSEYVNSIDVSVASAGDMDTAETEITDLLLRQHNIRDPELIDFNIFNQADIVATASSVTQTFTILLGAVAGISLIVGGIGIMNMMLTNVTERTREIGLRKALGAKRRDINTQFLLESVALTLVGGVIGVLLGMGIAALVRSVFSIAATVSLLSVIIAFSVSAAIGIIFGYYPARKASKLNPIDALRYE